MRKSIFDIITEYGINEGVNSILWQDDEYKQIQEKIDTLINEFTALGLSEKQRLLTDQLLTCYNESGACYGKITYQQGFRDCVSLLLEVGMIKGIRKDIAA